MTTSSYSPSSPHLSASIQETPQLSVSGPGEEGGGEGGGHLKKGQQKIYIFSNQTNSRRLCVLRISLCCAFLIWYVVVFQAYITEVC